MKLLAITISLIIICSCRSLTMSDSDYFDKLPRNSDVPGWLRGNTVPPKNSDKYKKQGVINSYGYYYNDGKGELSAEIIIFSSKLNAYGFYSLLRGRSKCYEDQCDYFSVTNDMALLLRGDKLVLIRTVDNYKLSRETMDVFIKSFRIHVAYSPLPELESAKKILHFNSNFVSYSPVAIDEEAGIDKVFYTTMNGTVFYFSKRNSKSGAFELFNSAVKRGNLLVTSSGKTSSAVKIQNGLKGKYIAIYNNYIFGASAYKETEENNRYIDKIADRIKK